MVIMLFPRTTCVVRQEGWVSPISTVSTHTQCKHDIAAYHHANVNLELNIHRVVQHHVHELIKASQRPSDLPVAVQGD